MLTIPTPKSLLAWMNERYPPWLIVVHSLVYAATIVVSLRAASQPTAFDLTRDLIGALALFSFPLLLRILDEHKDYVADCEHHPQRVLQRGDIALSDLRSIALLCVLLQCLFSVWVDGGVGQVTLLWVATIIYAALMTAEFFAAEWLSDKMLMYTLSHQIITPISTLWIGSIAISAVPSSGFIPFVLLATFTAVQYELSRKIVAPEDERDGIDSYTKAIGPRAAPLLTLCIAVAQAFVLCSFWTSSGLGASSFVWVTAVAIAALQISCVMWFMLRPSGQSAKSIEGTSALTMLLLYVTVLLSSWGG